MKYPTADDIRNGVSGKVRTRPPAVRLQQRYTIEPSGCWRWTGSLTGSGYAHFSIRHIYYQAHRLLYILHRGAIPEGLEPDHLCRNRGCVNPWHIELVSRSLNVQRGSAARLTPTEVEAIRAARLTGSGVRALARAYGVNHSTISRVVTGRTWKVALIQKEEAAA